MNKESVFIEKRNSPNLPLFQGENIAFWHFIFAWNTDEPYVIFLNIFQIVNVVQVWAV